MCKDNGEPLKILLGLSEDEILQPLPSSNPEHSPNNTATASKGGMQRLPCTTNILICQHVASVWFCNFRLTCFSNPCSDLLKSSSPVCGFFHIFLSETTDTDYHWLSLEKAWRQQSLLPLTWKWTGALLRVRQFPETHPKLPWTHSKHIFNAGKLLSELCTI